MISYATSWKLKSFSSRRSTLVTLGYAAGPIPAIALNLVMPKGVTVRGMEIRTFGTDYPQEAARDDAELARLFSDGRIWPYVGAAFRTAGGRECAAPCR